MSTYPDNLASIIVTQLRPRLVKLLKTAGSLADRRGWRAYLVGGAVRDLLLGKSTFDFDILVEEHGLKFAREYAGIEKGIFKLYRRFSTALVILPGGIKVDVTTTRSEEYPRPGALPEVLPGSLEEDLLRRDFTINALALALNRSSFGQLIDTCGGREDLEKGIIRVLHPRSFQDDPTRIFRAVRFQQRFDFTIEPRTEEMIRTAVNLRMFEKVSPERLRRELELILVEPAPIKAIEAMARYDELRFIHADLSLPPEQKRALRRLEEDYWWFKSRFPGREISSWRLYFGALIFPLPGKALKTTGCKFNLSRRFLTQLVQTRRDESDLNKQLSAAEEIPPSRICLALRSRETEVILILLARAATARGRARIKDYLLNYQKVRTAIGGEELKQLGLAPGPQFKKVLETVLFSRLDGRVNSREEELALARRLIDNQQ